MTTLELVAGPGGAPATVAGAPAATQMRPVPAQPPGGPPGPVGAPPPQPGPPPFAQPAQSPQYAQHPPAPAPAHPSSGWTDALTIAGIVVGLLFPIGGVIIGIVVLVRGKIGPGLVVLLASALGVLIAVALLASG